MSSEVVAGREARDGGNKQENTPLIVSYKKNKNRKIKKKDNEWSFVSKSHCFQRPWLAGKQEMEARIRKTAQ